VKKIFSGAFTAIHNELHTLSLDLEKLFVEKDSVKLIFVNGWLYKDSTLSAKLPAGVIVGNLASDGLLKHADLLKKHLTTDGDALAQLNAALWTDGAFIYIPEKTELKTTIEIVHISSGKKELLASSRNLIVVEKNSSV